jgi:transposase
MEATIFSGWIYDHLLPHATQIKVAHPLMLRAIAAAKKKNDQIDASKIADCLRCDFLPECHMMPAAIRDRRRTLRCHKTPPVEKNDSYQMVLHRPVETA